MIPSLDEPNLKCSYDPETQLAIITYDKYLSPVITQNAYVWMAESLAVIAVENVHGCIFDFTQVEVFGSQNLTTARHSHKSLHESAAEKSKRIPAALIYSTAYQETLIRTSMRVTNEINTAEYPRVLMVRSLDEAKKHLAKWHAEYDGKLDSIS